MGQAVGCSKTTKRKSGAGFSLLEVVAVLAMTGVIAAALVGSYLQTSYTQHQLSERITVLVLGEGKLAEAMCGSEQANSGEWQEQASKRKYHWYLQKETVENELSEVNLTVEWRGRDGVIRNQTFQGSVFSE
jgi:type II secretion system protein I